MAIRGVFFVFSVLALHLGLFTTSVDAETTLTGSIGADGWDVAAVFGIKAEVSPLADWQAEVRWEGGSREDAPSLVVDSLEFRTEPGGRQASVRYNGSFWPVEDRFRFFSSDTSLRKLAGRLVGTRGIFNLGESVVDREGGIHTVAAAEFTPTGPGGWFHAMAAYHDTGLLWAEVEPNQWDFTRNRGVYMSVQAEKSIGDWCLEAAFGHRYWADITRGETSVSRASALYGYGEYSQGPFTFDADLRFIGTDFRPLFNETNTFTPNRQGLRWRVQWDDGQQRLHYLQRDHWRVDGGRRYRKRQLRLQNLQGLRPFLLIQWQPTRQLRFGWRSGPWEWEARLDTPELRGVYQNSAVRVVGSLRPFSGWRLEILYRQRPTIRWVFKRQAPDRHYLFGSLLWESDHTWWELSLGTWDRGSFPARFSEDPELRLQFGWTF